MSPDNCWYEGDEIDKKNNEKKKMQGLISENEVGIKKLNGAAASQRLLIEQVKAFYQILVPAKVSSAASTAQRWADGM